MSSERILELWTRFLSREPLSPDEEKELLEALRKDPDLRAELLGDKEADGLLEAALDSHPDEDQFIADLRDRLEDERDATRFVKKLETRIKEGASEGAQGRRSTHRLAKPARDIGNQNYLLPALVAAAILFGIVLLFSLSSSSDPGQPEAARRERARAEAARKAAAQEDAARKAEEDRARAQEARKQAEERLAKLRVEEQQAKLSASAPQEGELRKKSEEAFAEILRKRKEEEARLAQLREAEKRAEEAKLAAAKPAPEPVPQEKPAPAPQRTQVAIAKFERAEEAYAVTAEGKTALKAGDDLLAGAAIEVGEKGASVIRFTDKTRLEIGSGSEVREFKTEGGKRLFIAKGTVSAKVERQAKGQEMAFATPHGEAKVLGTTLRLVVDSDPKVGTKLEVTEGKVQLTNLAGKTVDVPAGSSAIAAIGVDLVASRRRSSERTIWKLDFEDGRKPWAIVEGSVTAGPPRAGNRFSLESSNFIAQEYGPGVAIQFEEPLQGVMQVDPSKFRLRFRYFATGGKMTVQLFNATVKDNFTTQIDKVVAGQWASAEIPFSNFVLLSDRSPLVKGARLTFLNFFVTGGGKDAVYWDDLEIVEALGR